MLRLPGSVEPVFLDWLGRRRPLQAAKVEAAIRSVRGGKLNSSQFGERKRGTGVRAEQIAATFRVFAQQAGFSEPPFEYNTGDFQPPQPRSGQLRLF
jgi:DNA repair photolyase